MARKPKVNWMGVNGLGQVGGLHPAAGAALGVGLGTGTAMAVQTFAGMDKWSEAIGGGVGLLAGAGMMISPRTRGAGLAAVAATLLNNGIRFAFAMLSDKQKIKDLQGSIVTHTAKRAEGAIPVKQQWEALKTQAAASGLGIVSPARVPTLGAVTAQQRQMLGAASAQRMPLAGNGLGVVQAQQRNLANAGGLPTFQGQYGRGDRHGGYGDSGGVNIVGAGSLGSHYGGTCMG